MDKYYKLPIIVSLILSFFILIFSLLGECVLPVIIWFLIAFLVIFVGFWVSTLFIDKFKPWTLPITSAFLIYMGFSIMVFSRFKSFVSELSWDPSILGLGLAIVAFAFALFAQGTLKRIEEKIKELNVYPNDKIDIPGEPERIAILKEPLIIKPEPIKATIDISGTIRVTRSKEDAQKRLDEDTKKVGYQRGEIYQVDDDNWGIAWGGKYPL